MWSRFRLFDLNLYLIPLLLIFLGIVIIYTVTFPTVQFSLAQNQLIYLGLGFVGLIALTLLDYRAWQNLSYVLYLVAILLLIVVLIIDARQFGASRWIDLGFFQLQPSEVCKLVLILLLARILSAWSGAITIGRLIIIGLVTAIPIVLVFLQPDLGTAGVLVAITLGMLAFAKLPWRWWLALTGLGLLLLPVGYINLKPYQKQRVKTFINPEHDVAGQGYNVRQAAIAIGSGGLFGQGLGRGSQSQLNFLPVAHTDFIFAGLAEATGLLGGLILLTLYFVLLYRTFRVAELAKDSFGMFVALGIAIMIGFQVIINIGMNLGLVPVTGIPLPFVSYGGTSLIMSLASIGILQSIYIRHKKITF